jgi:hypothetical protein
VLVAVLDVVQKLESTIGENAFVMTKEEYPFQVINNYSTSFLERKKGRLFIIL